MGRRLLLTVIMVLFAAGFAAAERIDLGTSGDYVTVQVQESNENRIVVDFEIGAFDMKAVEINGETYYEILCGREGILLNKAEPALPRICRSVVIPDNAKMKISVLSTEYVDFPNTPVIPSKGNLPRTINPELVAYQFGPVYGSADAYPAEQTVLREPYILRDYRGTVIELNAFQYLPDSQTLRIYTSVTVELANVGPGEINVLDRTGKSESVVPDFQLLYERRFINYDHSAKYAPVEEAGQMLIITYGSFASAMQPFVDWKMQKGIKTTMVDVAGIGNNSTAIKGFVQAFYDTTDLAFLLLVGDAAQVATPTASGGSSDPSYALLAGSDNYPDILVGRFSAETVAHVETQVNRTITYELNPVAGDWFHKGTGVASNQGPGHFGEYDDEHVDLIRDDLLAFTYTFVDQIYDPTANATMVANALNGGRSIVNYTGHGSTTSWGSSGFSNSNVNSLVNDNMLPFIISVACVNGRFSGYTCFGEAWLRATNGSEPTGAIGAYMSSIDQSWSPPMYAQDEVTDLLVVEAKVTFGGLCFNGSCYMMDVNLGSGIPIYNTWHVFGDPSVLVRTDTPASMTVNHDGACFFTATEYPVEVVGEEGALCALYNDGVLYGSAYTNSGGIATIPIDVALPIGGTITLTVTGFNKTTLVDDVLVTSDLAIIHEPLGDTKITDTPYEVACQIYANTNLINDSLLIRYEVNSSWNVTTLSAGAGENDYLGYIPAQTPGTVVNYYIYAAAEGGFEDSTEVFTFRVIDYGVLLAADHLSQSAPVDDTVWYTLTVTNDGVLSDSYTINTWNYIWDTSVWDQTGSTEISSVGPIAMDQTADFKVRVIVPSSASGAVDIAGVSATSDGNPAISAQLMLETYSAGQPLAIPFYDAFAALDIDTVLWDEIDGVAVSDVGVGEPSAPYSLRFNGDPSEGDLLVSDKINLRGLSGVNISYYYQRTGGGNSTETGDDLFVEYLNDSDEWMLLSEHLGSGADMTTFEAVTVGVPLDGYHALFRLRFRNNATSGAYDDWFVDDIRVDYGPSISVSPASYTIALDNNDSTEALLFIENAGPGGLTYSVDVVPDFSRAPLFESLLVAGKVNPATTSLDGDMPLPEEIKGSDNHMPGRDVIFNAGGPDQFGYYWIDSDEPGGPTFEWVDISATGTDVTGLVDDNFQGPFPIGFDFPFYGNVYTEFYISDNGFIGFGPTVSYGAASNSPIPSTGAPNNIICWYWDDLRFDDPSNPGANVRYGENDGVLVVTFTDYPEYAASAGDVITAQVILYPSGNMKYQYLSIAGGFDIASGTIGIENSEGVDALEVALNTSYLHDNLAVAITKPPQWLSVFPASGELAPGESNTLTVHFNSTDTDSGIYTANINVLSNDPDPGDNPWVIPVTLEVGGAGPSYICGDADGNGIVEISDATYILSYIFTSGAAPDPVAAGDCDCDGICDVTDAVYLIQYILNSGQPPCAGC